MKLKFLPFAAAVLAVIGTSNIVQAVIVDGIRDTGASEYTGAVVVNQATVSNWYEAGDANNEHEALANLHAVQDGTNDLALHLAARVKNRGIILFIDSKAGGHNFIPNNLINFGGEDNYINNLGDTSSSGMTFESGFEADYAIRIYGDGGTGAFVNLYDLNARTREYAGNAGVGEISKGPIRAMEASGLGSVAIGNDTTSYAAANNGVEMKLDLAALGVLSGSQSVKLMVILVKTDSDYGSNQVLASRTATSVDIGDGNNGTVGIKFINFGDVSESGTQTISVPVNGPASRPVEFSVDMNQEIAKGFFNPVNHRVKVDFFSGLASPTPGEIYLTDDNADGIYTGTLVATGTAGDLFGTYKFLNTSGSPNFGFEYGDDRNFNLGPLVTTQTLSEVVFRSSYSAWAAAYSGGQPATDDNDGDGVKNGVECFMGSNNSQFTPNPAPVSGVITWPRGVDSAGIPFKVEVSNNLSTWQDAAVAYPANLDTSNPAQVSFTLPTGAGKIFTRLSVTP